MRLTNNHRCQREEGSTQRHWMCWDLHQNCSHRAGHPPAGISQRRCLPWLGGTSKVPSNPGLMGPYEITLLYFINCQNTDIQQDNVNNIYAPGQTRKITYLGTHHPGLLSKSGFTHAGNVCFLGGKRARGTNCTWEGVFQEGHRS